MDKQKKKLRLIRMPYWIGIFADAAWAFALFFPFVFGIFIGKPDFDPDFQTRLIMALGGSLMTGWTFLLLWAVRKPIERRVVILLTAFPVVFGLLIISVLGFLAGNTFTLWIIVKTIILFFTMIMSYILAGRIVREKKQW